MDDLLTDEPAIPSATRAYVASDAHTFLGKALRPFSIRVQIAAQALGNRLLSGRLRGMESSQCPVCGGLGAACPKCKGTGLVWSAYDGMFGDVVIVLYLCASPREEVKAAVLDPSAVLDHALDWAEQQKIVTGSPVYEEACAIYWAMMSELSTAKFEIEGSEPGGPSPNG